MGLVVVMVVVATGVVVIVVAGGSVVVVVAVGGTVVGVGVNRIHVLPAEQSKISTTSVFLLPPF